MHGCLLVKDLLCALVINATFVSGVSRVFVCLVCLCAYVFYTKYTAFSVCSHFILLLSLCSLVFASLFILHDKMATWARGWRRIGRHLQMTNHVHAEAVSRYYHHSLTVYCTDYSHFAKAQPFNSACLTRTVNVETKPHTLYVICQR